MAADVNSQVISPSDVNNEYDRQMKSFDPQSSINSKVDSHNTQMSFMEYSSENSTTVNILTELDTLNQTNVNNRHLDPSQDFKSSQSLDIIPNQEFLAMLDDELIDLPKDKYIAKLIGPKFGRFDNMI